MYVRVRVCSARVCSCSGGEGGHGCVGDCASIVFVAIMAFPPSASMQELLCMRIDGNMSNTLKRTSAQHHSSLQTL